MALWLASQPLVLASRSDIRGKILAAAALRVEIRPSAVDERAIEAQAGTSDPAAVARHLAHAKASAVAAALPGRVVIGADQTLALGARLFSKPAGRAQAADQLRLLAGGTHELHSAIAVARDGKVLFAEVSVARMTMRHLSESEIEAYLDEAGEAVTTSVGAYQLEGLGVHLFERIEGDHFTILGLPLLPLLAFLREQGLLGV